MTSSLIKILTAVFKPKDTRSILYATNAADSELYKDIPDLRIVRSLSDLSAGEKYIEKKGGTFYVYTITEERVPRFVSKSGNIMSALFTLDKIRRK